MPALCITAADCSEEGKSQLLQMCWHINKCSHIISDLQGTLTPSTKLINNSNCWVHFTPWHIHRDAIQKKLIINMPSIMLTNSIRNKRWKFNLLALRCILQSSLHVEPYVSAHDNVQNILSSYLLGDIEIYVYGRA